MMPSAEKRRPLPTHLTRPAKRTAGRTDAARTPAHVRTRRIAIPPDLPEYVRRRLGFKLGKYARSIERASVRLDDVNGPKGGVDKICLIKVVLAGRASVVVSVRRHDVREACDEALDRIEARVRKELGRARLGPSEPLRKFEDGSPKVSPHCRLTCDRSRTHLATPS
jgi:ribosome-associated translation inhibitor RaiA